MLNNLSIEGRLGRDPVLRSTNNGTPMLSFTMAHDNYVAGEKKTDWIKVVFFGKRAQSVAQYLEKGTRVGVSGSVTLEEWQDQNGNQRSAMSVNANDISLQQKSGNAGVQPQQPQQPQQVQQAQQAFGGQVVQDNGDFGAIPF